MLSKNVRIANAVEIAQAVLRQLSTNERMEALVILAHETPPVEATPVSTLPQRNAVEQAIAASPNIGEAATRLGVTRRTLQNYMRKLGIPKGKAGRKKRAPSIP